MRKRMIRRIFCVSRTAAAVVIIGISVMGCPSAFDSALLERIEQKVEVFNQAQVPDISFKQADTVIADGDGIYTFENAYEGSYEDVVFTIVNNGTGDLHLDNPPIVISGDHAAMFVIITPPSSNTLPAGQSTTFTLRFTPVGVPGTKTATIGIVNDDPDENPYNITVRGTIGPEFDLKVGAVDIASGGNHDYTPSDPVVLGTTVDVVFTISNPGTATLELSGSPLVAVSGADAMQFEVISPPAGSVAAKVSTSFTVRYLATKPGDSLATLAITSSDPDEGVYSVMVSGAGKMQVASTLIEAGLSHTVSRKTDGTVWTWGLNSTGPLGDGTFENSSTPVMASGLVDAAAVSAGSSHTIALLNDGTVWTWGNNYYGTLGDGTSNTTRQEPGQVGGLEGFIAVVAGASHNLALKSDGTVWAWGNNDHGQVGNGESGGICSIPVQVAGLTGIIAVSAGYYHSVALKWDGTVVAWGYNDYGQLGDGNSGNTLVIPTQVPGLAGVSKLAAGHYHTMALKLDGTLWAWGRNTYGQLGDGTSGNNKTVPVQVVGVGGSGYLADVVALAPASNHTIVLKSDGTVLSWGYNLKGQLGDGTIVQSTTPVQVSGLADVDCIAADGLHGMALKEDGTVWTWGNNQYGQLGNGTSGNYQMVPVQVAGISRVASMEGGQTHTVVCKSDTTVWAWGNNNYGQIGDGTSGNFRTMPVLVSGLTEVSSVAAGTYHSLALKSDGTVMAWGSNSLGQLGDGTSGNTRTSPVTVSGLSGVVAIAAGSYHTVALKSDGSVWVWGRNNYGQLGIDATDSNPHPLPERVMGPEGVGWLENIIAVGAGEARTVALKDDGTVWSWGDNSSNQLGDGIPSYTEVLSEVPVQVVGVGGSGWLGGVVAVSAGNLHTVALLSDGTLVAWGNNSKGQIGDGTIAANLGPVQVVGTGGTGFLEDVSVAVAGENHTIALKDDGTLWAWGSNNNGQLGLDVIDTNAHMLPAQVVGSGGTGYFEMGVSISSGNDSVLALKTDGTLWAWGDNYYGQLGDGTSLNDSDTPVLSGGALNLY